jgi:hypothetical protein
MDLQGWLIIVGFVVIAIVVYVTSKRRRKALESMALQLGWSFEANGEEALAEHRSLGLFGSSYSYVENVLKATGADCWIFDHRCTSGAGTSGRRVTTVASFRLGAKTLPRFSLSPESWFDQVGLSGRDIDFASHPRFSDVYFVRAEEGADEQAVRRLFPPAVLDFFTSEGGWSVSGALDRLIVYRHLKVVKPEALTQFFDQTRHIARLFGVTG